MLRIMPAGGYVPFAQSPGQHLLLLTLPAIAIGKGLAAVVFRMTRASVLDALSQRAEASAVIAMAPQTPMAGDSPIVRRARERAASANRNA